MNKPHTCIVNFFGLFGSFGSFGSIFGTSSEGIDAVTCDEPVTVILLGSVKEIDAPGASIDPDSCTVVMSPCVGVYVIVIGCVVTVPDSTLIDNPEGLACNSKSSATTPTDTVL